MKAAVVTDLPYVREWIWTLKFLTGLKVAPFNGLPTELKAMLAELDAARKWAPSRPGRRLLVFARQDFWTQFLLPISVVLAGREESVDFLWLPGEPHPDQQPRDRFHAWSSRFALPQANGYTVHLVKNFPSADLSESETEMARAIARYDTCYFTDRKSVV